MVRKRLLGRLIAVCLMMAVLATSTNLTVSATQGNNGNGNNKGKGNKDYIVSFNNSTGKDKVVKDKNKGKNVKNDFTNNNAIAITLTEQEALELQTSADVLYIEEDGEVEILSIGKPDKNDNAVKNMKNGTQEMPWGISAVIGDVNQNKYDGKKVRVAVFDTGISPHEDLTIAGGVSLVDYTKSYSDDNGHGTHGNYCSQQ